MIKKENGLTLIALIITIIVMIILAGVSLSLTTGDNGVLNKAKLAKEETRAGQIRDIRDIWFSDKQIAEEIGGESELLTALVNRLKKDGLLTDEEGRKILDTEEVQIGNQTISFKYNSNNTGNDLNQDSDNTDNEFNQDIDFETIIDSIATNKDTYLLEAEKKGQTGNLDIGIGTDGEVVNLSLWHYYKTDDGQSMSLGKGETCEGFLGYDEENLVNGKIQGKMPQYIYVASENKTYTVTRLESTFKELDIIELPELPETVNYIGAYAFAFTSLINVEIPNTVTTLGGLTFYNCDKLTSVTIPNSIKEFNGTCFAYCDNLENINLAQGLESIGSSMFSSCTNLKSIEIPSSVKTIGNGAFNGCVKLESVIMSEGLEKIEWYAFAGAGLTSINIPSTVTEIGKYSFSRCKQLSKISIDSQNKIYDSRNNCNAIIETATNTLMIGCNNTIIPNGVTSIEVFAFEACPELISINIPSSVTNIPKRAFEDCTGIANITVDSNNPKYDSRNNCNAIIESATNALIFGCKNTIIPNSVKSIEECAFYFCTGLTYLDIPNSVTTIKDSAFNGCKNLSDVNIPNSVTKISNLAFNSVPHITYNGSATGSPWGAKSKN